MERKDVPDTMLRHQAEFSMIAILIGIPVMPSAAAIMFGRKQSWVPYQPFWGNRFPFALMWNNLLTKCGKCPPRRPKFKLQPIGTSVPLSKGNSVKLSWISS